MLLADRELGREMNLVSWVLNGAVLAFCIGRFSNNFSNSQASGA